MPATPVLTEGRRRVLVAVATIGILAYTAIALSVDMSRVSAALRKLELAGCLAILSLSLINYLLRFFRWQIYLRLLGQRVPVLRHLVCYLAGLAFTVSPAKAGEAMRAVYLSRYDVPPSRTLAALWVERLVDLFAVIALATLILQHNRRYGPLLLGVGAAAAILLAVLGQAALARWLETSLLPRFQGRLSRWLSATISLLHSSRRLLSPRILLIGIVLGIIAWGAEGIGFFLICRGLQLSPALPEAIGIYSIAILAGSAAIFLPGGVGGMEIVMTTLLVAHGASLPTALIATLLCRLATLWFAVAIGLGAVASIEVQTVTPTVRAHEPG